MQWLVDMFVASLIKNVIAYLQAKWAAFRKQQAADAAIDSHTQEQAENLKHSETDKEDEQAAKDILSRHE